MTGREWVDESTRSRVSKLQLPIGLGLSELES
jgi:hypothetical protein